MKNETGLLTFTSLSHGDPTQISIKDESKHKASLGKIKFIYSLAERVKLAVKAKLKTKMKPAARFEDIGKPFYQTDSRIVFMRSVL